MLGLRDELRTGASPHTAASAILRRWPLIAAVGLVALAVVVSAADPGLDLPGWMAIAAMLTSGVVLAAALVRAGSADLFAPTVWFPIVVLGYYGVGSLPIGSWGPVPPGLYLVVLSAVGAFVTGAALVGGPSTRISMQPGYGVAPLNDRRLIVLLAVTLVCAIIGFAVIFSAAGIPILGAVDSARVRASASGYINTLALTVRAVVIVGLVALLLRSSLRPRLTRGFLALTIVVGLLLVASTGNRGHLVLLLLVGLVTFHYLVRSVSVRAVAAVALAGLVVYSVAGYQRSAQCDSEWADRVERHYGIPAQIAPLAPAYLSVRSVPFFLSEVIEQVPEEHPHTFGAMLASPLLTPLPGHQPGIGEFIKENILGLEFVGFGVAAGLFSPAYIDFGYGGVIVALLLAGMVSQAIYKRARTADPAWIAVNAFVIANLSLAVYGSLVNSFSVIWIPLVIFVILRASRADQRFGPIRGMPRHRLATTVATGIVAVGLGTLVTIATISVAPSLVRSATGGTPVVVTLPETGNTNEEDGDAAPALAVPSLGCRGSG